jgi:uncharacterized protein (DUF362 family)
MSKVALIKGDNRYENITRALSLLSVDVKERIKGKKRIVIKPNFVHCNIPLSATHVDAVKAILDFVDLHTNGKITIAEGSFEKPTRKAFENYGYFKLRGDYDVEFVDLNEDSYEEIELFDKDLKPLNFRVSKTIIESDFRISVSPMKTHDSVIVTLALKNMLVGSLIKDSKRDDKWMVHSSGNLKAMNLNLFKLAEFIHPHLSVIDGLVGMEGKGPGFGNPVEMNLALASLDFLACDVVGTYLMGFDPDKIGYLYYCQRENLGEGDLNKIEIVGNASLEECRKKFKPHPDYKKQLEWRIDHRKS